MDKLQVKKIKKIINGSTVRDTNLEKFIDNIFISSLNKDSHGLFLPFKGKNVDGHKFIEETISKKRRIYSLSEKSIKGENIINVDNVQDSLNNIAKYIRQNSDARIIGITGSNGKTTTKNMITSLLKEQNSVCSTSGNLNNFIGLPLSISKLKKNDNYGVFEIGISEPNEMYGLAEILNPDISIITSISAAHMEFYKNINEIKKEKCEISNHTKELSIINGDIEGLKEFCNKNINIITFGTKKDNDFIYTPIFSKGYLSVKYLDKIIKTNFIGVDNVYNIYASITLLIILGYTIKNIQLLFEDLKSGRGRMNLIRKTEFDIIDDAYNANPDSVKNLLKTMDTFGVLKRKFIVLGEMAELGKDSIEFHRNIVDKFKDDISYILKGDVYKKIIDEKFVKGKKNIKVVESNEEIYKYFKRANISNSVIGIKGSNSTKMFEVVNYLDKEFN